MIMGLIALLMACTTVWGQNGALSQVPDLCGTSNGQSLANSGFPGNPAAMFTALRCDPVINGYVASIFNGAQSITCANIPESTTTALTFTVDMTCGGPENNGEGVTGSLLIPLNSTTGATSTAISIDYGIKATELQIALTTAGTSIQGRNCIINLRANIYARIPGTDECVSCLNFLVETSTDTCGISDDEDDCNFFDLICKLDQGTWENSAFFWIVFILVMWGFMVIGYMGYKIDKMVRRGHMATRVSRTRLDLESKGMVKTVPSVETSVIKTDSDYFSLPLSSETSVVSRHSGTRFSAPIPATSSSLQVSSPAVVSSGSTRRRRGAVASSSSTASQHKYGAGMSADDLGLLVDED